MRQGYPLYVQEAGIQDAWQTAPVAWESCWDMRKWVQEGWSLRFIFNYALALHGSQFNNKSSPLPAGENVRPEIERFLRRLGYRLVLKQLSYPAAAKPGEKLALTMQWQNTGSAPCYRPYRLAYRLGDGKGFARVFAGRVAVHRWLPGAIPLFTKEFFNMPADLPPGKIVEVADSIPLPNDLPAGDLTLSLAVVGEQTQEPVVRLAIQGRADDGWYPLGKIAVAK
jgi:hypothetical protein